MKMAMLTTVDNPYNPFDEWEAWYNYDVSAGHHCSSLLARIAAPTDELGSTIQQESIEQAIDEICEENVNGMYRKVTKDFPDESELGSD